MTSECRASTSGTDECDKERLFPEFSPATYDAWYQEAVTSLKGAPFEKKVITKTYEDIDLQPMYWAKDVEELPHMGSLPGFPAYVRGTEPGGYVLKPWDICQEIACSSPEQFNEVARHELARGQNALKLVLDRPSRRGLDPDDDEATQVGQGGLSLATLEDLSREMSNRNLMVADVYLIRMKSCVFRGFLDSGFRRNHPCKELSPR